MEAIRSELAGAPVIIGGGLAGLMTALRLAPQPVILLAKTPLAQGAASAWAQGGVAAAVGEGDDPALHAADTLAAGDGLSDSAVAARIAAAGRRPPSPSSSATASPSTATPRAISLGLEAAHRRRRIVHHGRRHRGGDHARVGRRGGGHAVDHHRRRPRGAAPAGRRSRRHGRAGGGAVERLPAADPSRRARHRRVGRPLCPDDQSAGRHRPGRGAGRPRRCGVGRHGVRAVPSHRACRRARSHAAGQRGGARRGRGAGG